MEYRLRRCSLKSTVLDPVLVPSSARSYTLFTVPVSAELLDISWNTINPDEQIKGR